jgi:outer membrane immunogenic protein
MSRLLVVSAAAIALVGGAAKAADLPIGVPVTPPYLLPFTWEGVYLGLNLGGHWGNDRVSTTSDASGGFGAAGAAAIDSASPGTVNVIGATGGFQAGYNWQFGQVVAGIEADANGSSGSVNRTVAISPTPGLPNGATLREHINQPTFLLTVRPRLGWAFDNTLVYATAGYAFSTIQFVDSLSNPGNVLGASADNTAKLSGWTAGAGVEYAFARGVTAKLEYLYVGLGNFNSTIQTSSLVFVQPANIAVRHSYSDNIIRLGVNFHPTW